MEAGGGHTGRRQAWYRTHAVTVPYNTPGKQIHSLACQPNSPALHPELSCAADTGEHFYKAIEEHTADPPSFKPAWGCSQAPLIGTLIDF